MAELVRGSVADRPWGRTLAILGLRGVTGQLTLVAGGKRFLVAFVHGAVVASASPRTSDAAVRVALTNHLVSSSQVPEIARRLASAPERDEISVIAELARIGPEHALRLRRRVIAQRAAGTFSIDQGVFTVTDDTELTILDGCELDVRAVVYMGARANLSEARLSAEVDRLGAWFRLKPGIDDDLPQFGFTDLEQPVVERLRDGGTLAEIEDFATSFVDGRTVRAVVYALATCSACDLESPRSTAPSAGSPAPLSPPPIARSPAMSAAVHEEVVPSKTAIRRSTTLPPPQRPPWATASAAHRPPAPEAEARARSMAGRAAPALGSAAALGREDARDQPPGPSASGARGGDALGAPLSEPPGPGGASGRLRRATGEVVPRESSSPALRLPVREALGLGTTSGSFHLPSDEAVRRDSASGPLRLPVEEVQWPGGAAGRARRASEVVVRREGSGALRVPAEEPSGLPLPSEEAMRDAASSERRPDEDGRRRDGRHESSAGLRLSQDPEAGPGWVIRRVTAAGSAPARPGSRVDAPASDGVQALIAQRLKLLDAASDHFQLLGVPKDVAPDALRKAYFALARQLHPDRLAALGISDDGKHAQRLFAQINAGFATLSDPGRRAAYLDILRRGGEAAVRAEQARAEELSRRVLEAEEAFRRGEVALRGDQPAAAVVELERAIQLHPDEPDYHAALAWSRFCAAPDKPAVAAATRTALEAAIQRAPRSVTARFYLGRVERMLGRDPDALRHFRGVLAAVPNHAEAAAEVRALEARLPGGDKPGAGRPRR